jgi:hypothetical protein
MAESLCILTPQSLKEHPSLFNSKINRLNLGDLTREKMGLTIGLGLSELRTDTHIVMGMSGAPLIMLKNSPAIGGLAKSYHRFFKQSSFSTQFQINNLLNSFLNGVRGNTSTTHWLFRKDISTYRDFGNGTLEINPETLPSGDIEFEPAGGGESADGGKSSVNSSNTDSIKLKPGMLWHNKEVIGFRIQFKNQDNKNMLVYANRVGLNFINDFINLINQPNLVSYKPILTDSANYLELLKERLDSNEALQSKLSTEDGEYCQIDLKALSNGQIHLKLKNSELLIDKNGIIKNNKESTNFRPFAITSNKTRVDITGLFFINISQAEQEFENLRENKFSPLKSVFITNYAFSPYITIQTEKLPYPRALPCY